MYVKSITKTKRNYKEDMVDTFREITMGCFWNGKKNERESLFPNLCRKNLVCSFLIFPKIGQLMKFWSSVFKFLFKNVPWNVKSHLSAEIYYQWVSAILQSDAFTLMVCKHTLLQVSFKKKKLQYLELHSWTNT